MTTARRLLVKRRPYMASQTLILATLPNGLDSKRKKLNLSLFLTPRLEGGATLGAFPDILNWTKQVQAHGIKFKITCGAHSTTVAPDPNALKALNPDVWEAIFKPDTFVENYQVTDYTKQLIVSYPSRQASSYLKFLTQFVATNPNYSPENSARSGPLRMLNHLSFRDGSKSTFGDQISA